jgi:hypothetical protein
MLLCGYFILVHIPGIFSDFSALWHTSDSLSLYLIRHNEWPESWEQLSQVIDEANAGYGNPDEQYLRDRIEINFALRLASTETADWFVRVRSGRLQGEQEDVNQRLWQARQMAQERIRDRTNPSDAPQVAE